jgi:integrase
MDIFLVTGGYHRRMSDRAMNFITPSESRPDFIALCRRWHYENRALADSLLAGRLVHSELVANEWRDVTMDDADRHARIAAELESLLVEFARF